jgi:hypothetical protein
MADAVARRANRPGRPRRRGAVSAPLRQLDLFKNPQDRGLIHGRRAINDNPAHQRVICSYRFSISRPWLPLTTIATQQATLPILWAIVLLFSFISIAGNLAAGTLAYKKMDGNTEVFLIKHTGPFSWAWCLCGWPTASITATTRASRSTLCFVERAAAVYLLMAAISTSSR